MRRFAAPLLLLAALLVSCSAESRFASRDSRFAIREPRTTNHEATSPAIGQADVVTLDTTTEAPTTTEAITTTTEEPATTTTTAAVRLAAPNTTATAAPARTPSARSAPVQESSAPTTGDLACGGDLPSCAIMKVESRGPGYPEGGDPTAVNETGCGGRGCYGKWQFDPITSRGLGYEKTMDQYPVEVQDEAARQEKSENPCAWGC